MDDYGIFHIGYLHYDKKPMTIIICSSSVFKWVDIYARSSSSMTYAPHVNDDFVPRCQGFSGRFSAVKAARLQLHRVNRHDGHMLHAGRFTYI